MTDTTAKADEFFKRYAASCWPATAKAIAGMLFPGKSIPISNAYHTEEFLVWSDHTRRHDAQHRPQ
jgi:hypothetical protein